MDTIEEYKDPVLKKYADLIMSLNKDFKRVFYANPDRIGASEMPALIMEKDVSTFGNLSNVEDDHNIKILITVVTDVRDTISDDKEMVKGVNAMYNIMEGRNPDYTLKTTSLINIIRHNVEIDVGNNLRTDLKTVTVAPFPKGLKPTNRWKDKRSIECTIALTAYFTQNR